MVRWPGKEPYGCSRYQPCVEVNPVGYFVVKEKNSQGQDEKRYGIVDEVVEIGMYKRRCEDADETGCTARKNTKE